MRRFVKHMTVGKIHVESGIRRLVNQRSPPVDKSGHRTGVAEKRNKKYRMKAESKTFDYVFQICQHFLNRFICHWGIGTSITLNTL